MRAWQVWRHGEPERALRLADIELPEPGSGQLRVRVSAAGLGLPDVLMCRGRYAFDPALPFTPGQEVVGVVSAAGSGTATALGERVMAVTAFFQGAGGFAEEALVLEASAYRVPETLPDPDAASFVIPYHTAHVALVRRAGLRPGEWLLVHGAAGGSGAAAVQLGRALGARVIAAAAGPEKGARCLELGAERVLDSADGSLAPAVKEATGGRGVDVVFDPVGGEVFRESVSCLASEGRLLAVGFASGAWQDSSTARLVARNASVLGVYVGAYSHAELLEDHETLLGLWAGGRIRSLTERQVPFEDLPSALGELAARRTTGKSVLRVAC